MESMTTRHSQNFIIQEIHANSTSIGRVLVLTWFTINCIYFIGFKKNIVETGHLIMCI
jgi:hypothetical protein